MSDTYRLKTGKSGEAQLDLLDKMFGSESRKFLLEVGVQKGMQIADIGCGIGNLSFWLAEQTGPQGHVYAIDNNVAQLEVAKERAKQRGIENISFHHLDVYDLTQFNESFDLVYCRWLLEHISDPRAGIVSMAKAVAKNGILACESGDVRTNFYYPCFPAYEFFFKKASQLLSQTGCDANISLNIFAIFKSLERFSNLNIKVSQPVVSDPITILEYTRQLTTLVDSLSASLKEIDIMSDDEINQFKSDLQNYTVENNPLLFLSRMTQIWASKN